MGKLYARPDIYDLLDNDRKYAAVRKNWEILLKDKEVNSLLDVSIGTGALTLPLAEMGIELYGSDLSEEMLAKCAKNAERRGLRVDLQASDFRTIAGKFDQKFDCVASTGNSLAYVPNADVMKTLEQMDALVAPGGYLYFDTRNWDRILSTRQRFYTYNPSFVDDVRINLVQAWDYHEDGSMTFNLLYTFERENRIFQREHFEEHYNPISRSMLLQKLDEMGYTKIEQRPFPAQDDRFSVEECDWYCVIANKSR